MIINIDLTEEDLEQLVLDLLQEKLGNIPLRKDDVKIEVKSNQNYKSEWEKASWRVKYIHNI